VVALCMRGVDVNSKDRAGMTPLHEAAWHGHSEICKVLMSKGMDPDATDDVRRAPPRVPPEPPCSSGSAALSWVHVCGAQEASTPLHYAADNGHLETVKVLLDKGADQTLRDRWVV
jgi:ankyrin repeat protein